MKRSNNIFWVLASLLEIINDGKGKREKGHERDDWEEGVQRDGGRER